MKTVRPPKTTPAFMQLGYVGMIIACAVLVGKCLLDLRAQSGTAQAATAAVSPEPELSTTKTDQAELASSTSEIDKRIQEVLKAPEADLATPELVALNEPDDIEPALNESAHLESEGSAELLPIPDVLPSSDAPEISMIAPIRQKTQLHERMLTPGNFLYVGGFRPEFEDGQGGRFGLGGLAVTYRADGDPEGAEDGYPGSLFMVGHSQQQMVAEISIPAPRVSPEKQIDDLPVGKILQPFADATWGLRERMTNGSSEPFEIGGMHVLGNKLHWTLYKYYNVTGVDYPSHGMSSIDLTQRGFRGLWHLGPSGTRESRWHSYKNAGYITDIPQPIADKYFGGRNLMSGLQISTGRQTSSQGPALYAYRIRDETLPFGESLDAVPLLWYPMEAPVEQHHPTDSWQGASWLTLGGKQAVIVVGRKGHGRVHYGMPRPGECYDYKGYHASSYEAQVLFYRPEDLAASSKRKVPDVTPWYRWDSTTPGGGFDRFMYQECRKQIGGITLDRARNILYVVEVDAALSKVNDYEKLPVVHVFKIVD